MSTKANPTVIGAFVLGSIILVIAGILVFGSGKVFESMETHVLYFQSSVKGLSVGSPVNFRGVKIGQVREINMIIDRSTLETVIPVVVEIDPSRFQVCCDDQGQPTGQFKDPYKAVDEMIQLGLRAQLDVLSLVTGQLVVNLDLHPDTPIVMSDMEPKYHEIPTIPSSMEKFFEKISQLPIDQIASKAVDVLDAIDTFMRTPELQGSVVGLDQTLEDSQLLIKDGQLLIKDVRRLTQNIDKEVEPLSIGAQDTMLAAQETMRDAQKAIQRAEAVMDNLEHMTGKRSQLRVEVLRALREVNDAMRSLRVLTEYLETHPEALLQGKPETGGQP